MQKKPPVPFNDKNVLLLCQSKRFPGEYYCFNTSNGEAMWCRSEDKPSFKSCVGDTNAYPEPYSPPHNYNGPNNNPPTAKHRPPTFGMASFPNYLPRTENVHPTYGNVWTFPNQKVFYAPAVPMFMPNYSDLNRVDRVTQTSRDTSPVIVETTRVPMSRRVTGHFDVSRTVNFGNCQNSTFTQSDRVGFKPTTKSISIQTVGADVHRHIPVPRKRTMSEDSEISKLDCDAPMVKFTRRAMTTCNTELTSICGVEKENVDQAAISNPNKDRTNFRLNNNATEVQSDKSKSVIEAPQVLSQEFQNVLPITVPNLAKDDLRYKLLARRRKTIDCPQTSDQKEIPEVNPPPKPADISAGKKKVTFDFNNAMALESPSVSCETFYEDCEGTYADLPTPTDLARTAYNTAKLRSLVGHHAPGKCWYIAADIEVLLNEFRFIEDLVQSDKYCRLMIPTVVRLQLANLCSGLCVGSLQSRVLVARQLSRRLATADFVVQEEKRSSSIEPDGIIDCCKRFNVILITNQTTMHTKATSKQLICLTVEKANEIVTEISPIHFDAKDIKISVKNFTVSKEDTNLFLRNEILANDKQKIFSKEIRFKGSTPPLQATKLTETPDVSRQNRQTVASNTNLQSTETNLGLGDLNLRDKSPILGRKPTIISVEVTRCPSLLTRDFCKTPNKRNQASTLEDIVQEFESELQKFSTLDLKAEETLVTRKEEWLCRFVQILEEALTSVVFNSSSPAEVPTPLLLDEALSTIVELYSDLEDPAAVTMRVACDEIANLFVCPAKQGDFVQIKQDVDSKDLMRILGSGVILIKLLIRLHPANESLHTAEERLQQLLQDARQPGLPPGVSFSDFNGKDPCKRAPEDVSMDYRLNMMKKPSEVLEYLKRHFPAWQHYERPGLEVPANVTENGFEEIGLNEQLDMEFAQNTVKIIRTCGRDLGRLKLRPRAITMEAAGRGQRDDFTSDSGICQSDESQHAKPLINTFLGEISDFFIVICDIVKSIVTELNDGLKEERKRVISRKVKKIQRVIEENRTKLLRIVEREASDSESTLKMLITKVGVSASIKMTRYRQVVMKLIEQADILNGSLQTIAKLANGIILDPQQFEQSCDIKYINIFDALSNT